MLTRIEIDGFKSFEQFSLDVAPFTVILGPNASGKSNLFDAILLLSQLAATDLRSALKGLRGDPLELFCRQADGSSSPQMSFAVELLLAPQVRDPWGEGVELSHSRVRYEVQIEYRKGDRHLDHLRITQEAVTPIFKTEDQWCSNYPSIDTSFSKLFLKYNGREPWLTTKEKEGKRIFKIAPDGRQGKT
jgi:energy-coupling factor transporter ATP-binding protein EcfA2